MNFWIFYFAVAIVSGIYVIICFLREKETDKTMYIATICSAIIWPLTCIMVVIMLISERQKEKKQKENKMKEAQEMISALEAKALSQKNREEKISIMTENMITEVTRNINIAVKVGEMGTTCRFIDENGIEEAIEKTITILEEFGFNVNYDADLEFPTTIQAGQDPQGIRVHILDISWEIEDEQDNS